MADGVSDSTSAALKTAAAVGLAGAASAAIWYYFLKEDVFVFDPESDSLQDVTPQQTKTILDAVMKSQDDMEKMMARMLEDITQRDISFSGVCDRVKLLQPRDPLKEVHNLTVDQFSELLDLHKSDAMLKPYIRKLTIGPTSKKEITPGADSISQAEVVQVHRYMVNQLRMILRDLRAQAQVSPVPYTPRVVTIAAQAYIAGKVYSKYNLKSYDLECLVAKHQTGLIEDQIFIQLSASIRHVMVKLVDVADGKNVAHDPADEPDESEL